MMNKPPEPRMINAADDQDHLIGRLVEHPKVSDPSGWYMTPTLDTDDIAVGLLVLPHSDLEVSIWESSKYSSAPYPDSFTEWMSVRIPIDYYVLDTLERLASRVRAVLDSQALNDAE